ncbi:hypothetical protein [Kribbella sp. CA-247076]|uniref:hypothetical protein n=1 Tax=Kribbella sp. CA-247076 TaxID=3239941 RepID=UPI003D8CFFB8
MNSQSVRPPEFDLDPRTRARQRAELVAIVDHEAAYQASSPRRRAVPLLAAAAVVVVIAGLAFAVPALRGDEAQPPAAGQQTAVATPALEPLTAAERAVHARRCDLSWGGRAGVTGQPYTVVEAFRWVNPPADTSATSWVLLKSAKLTRGCGFGPDGRILMSRLPGGSGVQRDVVDGGGNGSGTYTKGVTRVTIALGNRPAIEAVLRNGFFFAPTKYLSTYDPKTPDAPPTHTVRAYDAAGKLLYATPKTQREWTAELDGCYTDPDGTRVVFSGGGISTPPISQCKRGVAWNW